EPDRCGDVGDLGDDQADEGERDTAAKGPDIRPQGLQCEPVVAPRGCGAGVRKAHGNIRKSGGRRTAGSSSAGTHTIMPSPADAPLGGASRDQANGKDCMTVSVFDYEAELSACAAGDRSAFLALYRHESPAMRALALAMLDDSDAADAVLHETFVLIWRNAAGYSPAIGTARAWIYSILRYRAAAHARQMRAEGRHPAPPPAARRRTRRHGGRRPGIPARSAARRIAAGLSARRRSGAHRGPPGPDRTRHRGFTERRPGAYRQGRVRMKPNYPS